MNYLQELKKLGQLKNDGKLTEEEFQEKKEKILSQSSKTKGNKTESEDKKKKGFFESAFEKTLDNRLEKVTKLFSTDQEALKEWKKYKRQYKNKRITLTALRKKAKELKNEGYALTKTSIESDMASMSVDSICRIEKKKNKIVEKNGSTDKDNVLILNNQAKTNKSEILVLDKMVE